MLNDTIIFIGVDMSFKRAGVATYAPVTRFNVPELVIGHCTTERDDKSFVGTYTSAVQQVNRVTQCLGYSSIGVYGSCHVCMEVPPPIGQYAAGLWLLDGLMYKNIRGWGHNETIFTVHPSKISNLLREKRVDGKKKYKKGSSTKVAREMIRKMISQNSLRVIIRGEERDKKYLFEKERWINNDEADAFMLLSLIASFDLPEYIPLTKRRKWHL